MKHLNLSLVALFAVLLVGCAERNITEYETRGRVVSLTPETNSVTILHESIPGYMESAEMTFIPSDAGALEGLMVGDLVEFDIEVAEDGSTVIDDIEKLPADTQLMLNEPAPAAPIMPDTSMTMSDTTLVMEDTTATL